MAVRSLSRSPTKKKGKIPPPPFPFLFPRMGEGEFFCRRTAPSIANIFCAIWGSQLFSHFSPQTVRNSSEKWQERNGCAHCRALYIFCFFRTLKVPLTFCLFSCSLKAPMEMCWTVGKHYKPESFSSCRLMGSRKSGTIKFLPPPVSFGQNPPLLAKRRKKSRVGCTKHKEAKADSMEDGRRREAPLSFGECPKKEALARNAEEKKKRIKKRKSLVLFLCWKMEKKKKKSHTRQKSSPTKKRKKLFPAPFLHRRDIVAPVFVHFPIFSAELTNCQNCRPFSSSPNLLSSLVRPLSSTTSARKRGREPERKPESSLSLLRRPLLQPAPLLLFLSNPSEGICRRTRRRRRRTEKKGKKKLVLVLLLLLYSAIAASLPPSSFHDGKTFFCLPPFLCPVPAPPPLPFSILSTLSSSSSLLHFPSSPPPFSPGKVGEENNRVGRRRLQKRCLFLLTRSHRAGKNQLVLFPGHLLHPFRVMHSLPSPGPEAKKVEVTRGKERESDKTAAEVGRSVGGKNSSTFLRQTPSLIWRARGASPLPSSAHFFPFGSGGESDR